MTFKVILTFLKSLFKICDIWLNKTIQRAVMTLNICSRLFTGNIGRKKVIESVCEDNVCICFVTLLVANYE